MATITSSRKKLSGVVNTNNSISAVTPSDQRLTGVVSTGNGSANIDSTLAEKIAESALETAEEALKVVKNLETAADQIITFNNKLEAEITRSTTLDKEHRTDIDNLSANAIQVEFLDNLSSEELWNKN